MFIRMMPIVGHLPNCTTKDHVSALKEFVPTIVFGTATFWLTAVILKAFKTYAGANFLGLVYETTYAGQLFIFAVGMLGPILIASAVEPPNTRQFPGRLGHFAILILLGALASGLYAVALAGREPEVSKLIDSDYVYTSSIVIAALVVVMRYLTTVYRKNTQSFDTEERLKAPEKEFAETFAARHEVDPLTPSADNDLASALVDRFNARGATP